MHTVKRIRASKMECDMCGGMGVHLFEMGDVSIPCVQCNGKRYIVDREALAVLQAKQIEK